MRVLGYKFLFQKRDVVDEAADNQWIELCVNGQAGYTTETGPNAYCVEMGMKWDVTVHM